MRLTFGGSLSPFFNCISFFFVPWMFVSIVFVTSCAFFGIMPILRCIFFSCVNITSLHWWLYFDFAIPDKPSDVGFDSQESGIGELIGRRFESNDTNKTKFILIDYKRFRDTLLSTRAIFLCFPLLYSLISSSASHRLGSTAYTRVLKNPVPTLGYSC